MKTLIAAMVLRLSLFVSAQACDIWILWGQAGPDAMAGNTYRTLEECNREKQRAQERSKNSSTAIVFSYLPPSVNLKAQR